MKKSIKTKMLLGTIGIVASSMLILSLTFLFASKSLMTQQFIKTADEELRQAGGTIDMFLLGVTDNIAFLANQPDNRDIHENMTTFTIPEGHVKGRIRSDDTLGNKLSTMYSLIEKSHESYVDVYLGTIYGGFISGSEVPLPEGFDPRVRPWYIEALDNPNSITVSDVYQSTTGAPVITICDPLLNNGKVNGVVGIDVTLSNITNLLNEMSIGKSGKMALIQGDGTIIANPLDTALNFTQVSEDHAPLYHSILQKPAGSHMKMAINGKRYIAYKSTKEINGVNWQLVGFISASEINAPLIRLFNINVVLFLVILVIIIFVLRHNIEKTLITPLKGATTVVTDVSEGDFHTSLVHDRVDEIGDIQEGLLKMTESLKKKTELAQKISQGDLTDHGVPSSDRDDLGIALQDMVESLNEVMQGMQEMVVQVSTGSNHLAQASQSLSDGATQQAAAVEQITSTVNEIEDQLTDNAKRAKTANTLAEVSKETAQTGSEQMQEMLSAMKEISAASNEISQIMKVIDDIAFQTNLLALNAAVEAARAGQHGKGFAVVAVEDRNLAQRSANAAGNTASRILSALDKITQGNSIAAATSESFEKIKEKISESSSLISSIAQSTDSEATSLGEVVQGLEQISDVTQNNTAGAEETASTSSELSNHALQLQEAINRFKILE